MLTKYPKTDQLLTAISAWTQPLIEHPAFRELARAKIGSAIDWEDGWPSDKDRIRQVDLPTPLDLQHEAVMQFYNLWQAVERLKTVEFYFRRYPFQNLPISHHEHLEHICTLFFSYFYIVQERLRVFLNALNKAVEPNAVDVGKALKLYQRHFHAELRERHETTHSAPFDDLTIQAVMLRSLRAEGSKGVRHLYRKAAREWAGHANRGGRRVSRFLEGIAGATLEVAVFLKSPASTNWDALKTK